MAKVYKEHADRRTAHCRPEYRTDPDESRNALSWLPVFTDGISGKSSNGPWLGRRCPRSSDQ